MNLGSAHSLALHAWVALGLAALPGADAAALQEPAGALRLRPLQKSGAVILLARAVNVDFERTPLADALEEVARQADLRLAYSNDLLPSGQWVSLRAERMPLGQALARILRDTELDILVSPEGHVALVRRGKRQTTGTIVGMVTALNHAPLPSARVAVAGTPISAFTSHDGRFVMPRVPAGAYTIMARYLGYRPDSQQVKVEAGQTSQVTFRLTPAPLELKELTVLGTLTQGQAKALNEQKNAPNIQSVIAEEQFERFPDRNGAEAVQRIPGVAITRDQGEGELIQVRGLPAEFNSVTLNGQRLPAPEHDFERQVGLDLFQVELMQSIEVTKALTPDMDADAIGGRVNFSLKQAPERPSFTASYSAGLNQQESNFRDFGRDIQQGFLAASHRFLDGRLGVIGSGSYYDTDRGSLLRERTYDGATTTLERLRANDYDVHRVRLGGVLSADYRFADRQELALTANYNRYEDDELRRRAEFMPLDQEEGKEVRNRREDQSSSLLELRGRNGLGMTTLDYTLFAANAKERLPNRTRFIFERDNAYTGLTNADVGQLDETSAFPDLPPLVLDGVRYELIETRERDRAAAANLAIPYRLGGRESEFKVGGKFLRKTRDFEPTEQRAGVLDDSVVVSPEGGFALVGEDYRSPVVRALPLEPFEADEDTFREDYTARENVAAGYLMTTHDWSERLTTLGGVRVERTTTRYRQTFTGLEDGNSYTSVLPSLHVTYRATPNTNARLALSTGFSRPSYSDLVPRDEINADDLEIQRGNAALKPTRAQSLDFLVERYTSSLGLLSGGVFVKWLDDPPSTLVFQEIRDGETFEVTQPTNGQSANVLGFELAFNQRLSALGVPLLRSFGVYGNYTFSRTRATFGSRRLDLPGAPLHTGNLALLFDNSEAGVSATLAGAYRSASLLSVGEADPFDLWLGEEIYLDFSATKTFANGFGIVLRANNLTNQPEQQYLGDPGAGGSRLHQTITFGRWYTLGIRLTR